METLRQLREAHRIIRTIQGLAATVLAYSVTHYWMDKDAGMREVWGWFVFSSAVVLIAMSFASRYLKDRAISIKCSPPPKGTSA
jgi:hypothetical protein